MAQNNSESSDDESGNFTTTNVLLGYASKEATDDEFSQLGGYPAWLDQTNPPSAELAKCKICNSMMTLLLQLNGDLPEKFPGHERKIYVFSCKRKACRKKEGTVRAIRCIKVTPTAAEKSTPVSNSPLSQETSKKQDKPSNLGNSIFNPTFSAPTSSNQNPFSSSTTPNSQPTNPFASSSNPNTSLFSSLASKPPQPPSPPAVAELSTTFAQKARITSSPRPANPAQRSKEPWPSTSSLPKPYPSYHLDAEYESLDSDPPPPSSKTAMDIDTDGPSTSSSKDDPEKDAFESTLDKTFQKFADRLSQNPEQVLRYEFGGPPLLYSKSDAVGRLFTPPTHPSSSASEPHIRTTISHPRDGSSSSIPRCQNCNGARVFELQLVPHAIAELEVEEEGLEGMEWGTVILGVCARDCAERGVERGEVGWVEEWVGVQWEEEAKGGKS